MGQKRTIHEKWTYDTAYTEAKKYTAFRDFMRNSQGAYKASKRNGCLDSFTWLDHTRKKKSEKYPFELCYSLAAKCTTLNEYAIKYPKVYKKACNERWVDQYTWLDKPMSHDERYIEKLLIHYNIEYEKQKSFPWLKYKRTLKIDFYLPDYNIALEVQGLQHFVDDIEYFGGAKTNERDIVKHKQCTDHGVRVLYYSDKQLLDRYFVDYTNYLDKVYTNPTELIMEIISTPTDELYY